MSGVPAGPGSFRVGEWTADPAAHALRRNGEERAVEPRVMRLLVHLASRPGRVVGREELIRAVWDGAVVGEGSIHRAVWALREALGDDPRAPRYVETIRKGGYRLVAPVAGAGFPSRRPGARRRLFLLPAALLAGAILLFLVLRAVAGRGSPREEAVLLDGHPVTASPGRELFPHLSPDGERAVFSRADPEGDDFDLFTIQRNGTAPVRLTKTTEDDLFPRWSPAGDSILFVRSAGEVHRLALLPAAGGAPRTLHESAAPIRDPDWSPDGSRIAFAVWDAATFAYRLRVLRPATGDLLEPVRPEPGATSDLYPRFSPDGSRLAFVRRNALGFYRILLADAGGGEGRFVAAGRRYPSGLAWMPGGGELLVTASPVGPYTLWRVDAATGRVTGLAARNRRVWSPSVSRDGTVLLYATGEIGADVMAAPPEDGAAEARPLIRSTRMDAQPRHSPDGKRIAFVSDRSGAPEIWIARRDGGGAVRLTSFDGGYVFHPAWSPDGSSLAFSVGGPEGVDAWRIDGEGGKPRLVAGGPGNDAAVSWSRDGGWIYLASDREGEWRLWKVRPDGSGARRALDAAALRGEESPDGRWLYYLSLPACRIHRVPIPGGGEADTILAGGSPPFDPSNWIVTPEGLYFLRGDGGDARLHRLDPETGAEEELRPAPNALPNAISLSPDGAEFLYGRYEQTEADLMAADRFR